MNDVNEIHFDAFTAFLNETPIAEEEPVVKSAASKTRKMKRKLDGNDNVEEKRSKIDIQDTLKTEIINPVAHLKDFQQFTAVESVLNNWLQQT